MARITVEDCLETVGDDNRFSLIHLAVERIKQHRKGEPFLVAGKNKEIVTNLRELKGMSSVDYVTGPYDVIAIVEAENLNEIGDLVTRKIHPIQGITRTITCLALRID